jgi:hypothetical protein
MSEDPRSRIRAALRRSLSDGLRADSGDIMSEMRNPDSYLYQPSNEREAKSHRARLKRRRAAMLTKSALEAVVDFRAGKKRARVRHGVAKADRPQCGARCRSKSSAPCIARVCQRADGTLAKRCRMHGGLSTGPRTAEGRERAREAGRRGRIKRWGRRGSIAEASADCGGDND